ncbi:glucose-6-phosphate dehydrogenase [Phototrophicus methaneseepsis]|uniref:Glucose-6-phosphate 1-dehydrogenase n=1 Tax=Phototrophicus methaneseepsis TaxID=2710758 RepID=A0A7S8IDI1_9CHLR|nr:glucose-6-phosphate dehydrogenase [Phototrophicus methaneseepsis]QPC81389.1 glucose-6-phosphate dehydrogenase [Phototrophicus methaneseepsis]
MTITSIIIFGASGDLTRRKLIPALFHQYQRKKLPEQIRIVGVSRTKYSHDDFRDELKEHAKEFVKKLDEDNWAEFAKNIYYCPSDAAKIEEYDELQANLEEIEGGEANRLYYLSVAPFLYAPIIQNLGEAGMNKENGGWRRIIIEKPFGTDLESAKELNKVVHNTFQEDQVYRIDHYLGKETAQNILFFRFANTIFEPVWSRNYIDNVQITVAETVDVGTRADYYDKAGVLRDMFQNHILQLLMLVAMEPPASFNATALRNEKVKVLQSIRPVANGEAIFAQYADYRKAKGVAEKSVTPTYAAVKLQIDNWRWKGVPFYLRSGKALKNKVTKIVVEFKSPPHMLFKNAVGKPGGRNILSLCIQPDEGIHLQFEAKVPGEQAFRTAELQFHYSDAFSEPTGDAYERLILDAIEGDAALFTRSDEIEAAWALFDPIIARSEHNHGTAPFTYQRGSMGPLQADEFIAEDGRVWRKSGCVHE